MLIILFSNELAVTIMTKYIPKVDISFLTVDEYQEFKGA